MSRMEIINLPKDSEADQLTSKVGQALKKKIGAQFHRNLLIEEIDDLVSISINNIKNLWLIIFILEREVDRNLERKRKLHQ